MKWTVVGNWAASLALTEVYSLIMFSKRSFSIAVVNTTLLFNVLRCTYYSCHSLFLFVCLICFTNCFKGTKSQFWSIIIFQFLKLTNKCFSKSFVLVNKIWVSVVVLYARYNLHNSLSSKQDLVQDLNVEKKIPVLTRNECD